MASSPELIAFDTPQKLASRVADLVAGAISNGPPSNRLRHLAVSGGATPKTLYEELAKRDLLWDNIKLTLVDERWVPLQHERSNEAFVRKAFADAGCEVTGLFNGLASAREGARQMMENLNDRPERFDAVVLGMGGDGHTASWFPHADGLENALVSDDFVGAIIANKSEFTGEETERLTLTLSAIKSARLIILLITGAEKRAIFEKALEDGPVEEMPVRAILRARPDMCVCWAP